jgi:ABC-type transporter lipoprotein component MlaA
MNIFGKTAEGAKTAITGLVDKVQSIVTEFDANIAVIEAEKVSNVDTIARLQAENELHQSSVDYAKKVRDRFASIIEA